MTERAAAAWLGVSPRTLQAWRYANRGPKWAKAGRLIRYFEDDLEDYLRSDSDE